MKIKCEPNEAFFINDRKRKRRVFMFQADAKGIAEVPEALQHRFINSRYEILTEEENTLINDPEKPVDMKKCNKCGAEFENQGDLLYHYRKIHPKKR